MKNLVSAALVSAFAISASSAAFAGGQTAPLLEGEPAVETQPATSIGAGPGLLIGLLVVGGLVALGGGSDSGTATP